MQLTVQSAAEFAEWMVSARQRYEQFAFTILKSEVRVYQDLADARLVLEIREQEVGKPLETVHSLDLIHLIRQKGEWRVMHHAWAMEAPEAPLVASGRLAQ